MASASRIFDGGFNYDKARKHYLTLVEEKMGNEANLEEFSRHTAENVLKLMHQVKMKKENRQTDDDFEVIKKDGKEILVKKRPFHEVGARILTFQDVFYIYMQLHLRFGHASKEWLLEQSDIQKYIFPRICMELIIQTCDVCNDPRSSGVIKEILSNTQGKKSSVYVISVMQKRLDQWCQYLLIYEDKATNFVLLRPIMQKTEKEVSLTLFQIFTQFGPPEKLYMHGYDPDHTKRVDSLLKELCPMFNVLVEHKRMYFDLPTVVSDKMDDWRNKTKSDFWELGCSIVQRDLNNRYERNPYKDKVYAKPFKLYFTEFKSGGEKKNTNN